jgi:cytochrome c oxidase subunit IV
MAKKSGHRYWFWRWIIMSIVRFNKLYFLVWGVLFLLTVISLKTDILNLIGEFLK